MLAGLAWQIWASIAGRALLMGVIACHADYAKNKDRTSVVDEIP